MDKVLEAIAHIMKEASAGEFALLALVIVVSLLLVWLLFGRDTPLLAKFAVFAFVALLSFGGWAYLVHRTLPSQVRAPSTEAASRPPKPERTEKQPDQPPEKVATRKPSTPTTKPHKSEALAEKKVAVRRELRDVDGRQRGVDLSRSTIVPPGQTAGPDWKQQVCSNVPDPDWKVDPDSLVYKEVIPFHSGDGNAASPQSEVSFPKATNTERKVCMLVNCVGAPTWGCEVHVYAVWQEYRDYR